MAIPNSIARNAGGIRQRFVRLSSTRQTAMIQSRRYWTRAAVLAIIANLALFTPTAQAQSAVSNDATLNDLSLWRGGVSFSFRGVSFDEKGLQIESKEIKLGDKLKLNPDFTEGVKSYTATICYDETSFSLIASGSHPGTTIEVTSIGVDGAPLKTGTSMNDLNIKLKETEMRADVLRSFKQVPLGRNTITVEVTGEDGSTTQTTTVTVVRLEPDMDDEEERALFFLASINDENVDGVRRAIEAGVDVNAWHALGGKIKYVNPLRLAMGKENLELVQILIQAGADVNDVHPDGDGVPPLLLASQRGAEQIVRLLIDAGADVNVTLPDQKFPARGETGGVSVLMLAINNDNEAIVRLLINAKADVNYKIPGERPRGKNPKTAGLTALWMATRDNREAIVRLLIDAGADVNVTLPDQKFPARGETGGVSLLMIAINHGYEDIVRLLIDAGADVNYKIPGERSRGKNPKTAGLTALWMATRDNREATVRLLIDAGADVNVTLPDQKFPARGETGGVSLLMIAINKGHEEMVRLLIAAGVDVNYKIPGERPRGKNPKTAGLTALRIAKAQGRGKIVGWLREAGATD